LTRSVKLLLDADVVLDVLAHRRPHYATSADVWRAVEARQCEGLVAAHTVTTIHCLVARHRDRSTASGLSTPYSRYSALPPSTKTC